MKPNWGNIIITSVVAISALALEIAGKGAGGLWLIFLACVIGMEFDSNRE